MIERIGLVVHGGKAAAIAAAELVRRWSSAHGVACVDIDVWSEADQFARLGAEEEARRAGNPDLIVTVGGDGTLLRGVRIALAIDALVLGVDVGRIGFLTEVEVDEIGSALDTVARGAHTVDARLALTMRASRPLEIPPGINALLKYGQGPALPPPKVRSGTADSVGWGVRLDVLALNDVVFEKLARNRQASLAVYVSGRLFASYSADALIVASSTGSTAYSFAAGGPVVSPDLDALVFTPVAPHMVFNRSLVLSARVDRIAIHVLPHSGRVAVTVDGEVRGVMDPGDWVGVYAAAHRAKLARFAEVNFLGRVRSRFGLTDSAAAVADGAAPARYEPADPIPDDLAHPGPPDVH